MRRRSSRAVRFVLSVASACLLAGCGSDESADQASADPASSAPAGAARAADDDDDESDSPKGEVPEPIAGRTGELVNPDASAMVLLYYDMAGIAPPIERWVEADSRVTYAKPIEKPAAREMVRSELNAAVAAVRGIGVLRLTLQANISDYDPTYGEFTLRALAPSSVIHFDAFQQKVEVRFANGLKAQTWKVPPEDSQAIRDILGQMSAATADVLLVITSVQPAPGGGSFTADIVEYELREDRSGQVLARVRVPH